MANTVITAGLINKVEDLVRNDCYVTLRMLAAKVDVNVVFQYHHNELHYEIKTTTKYGWYSLEKSA